MWWTIVFVILYLLLFPVKALRDYIALYKAGYHYRWNNSPFTRLPQRLKNYLLDKDMPIDYEVLDGWHQLDGAVFMLPMWFITTLLAVFVWNVQWFWIPGICIAGMVVGYQYFNLMYHYVFQRKKEKWFFRR